MYCIKNPKDLTKLCYNSLTKNPDSLNNFIRDLDMLVKRFNKDFKSLNYWKNFKKFDNPTNNKQAFANAIANQESGSSSLYAETTARAKEQFNAIVEGIEKYLEETGNEKLKRSTLKKIETRRNRFVA